MKIIIALPHNKNNKNNNKNSSFDAQLKGDIYAQKTWVVAIAIKQLNIVHLFFCMEESWKLL